MKDVDAINGTQTHGLCLDVCLSVCACVSFKEPTSFILILPPLPRPLLPPEPPPGPPSASPAFVPVFVFFCDKQIDRQYAY